MPDSLTVTMLIIVTLTYGGRTKKLKDDYITGMLALQYKFKEWLELDTGYLFSRRDSSFPEFDYTSNYVIFKDNRLVITPFFCPEFQPVSPVFVRFGNPLQSSHGNCRIA